MLFNRAKENYSGNNISEAIALLDQYIINYPRGMEIIDVYFQLGEIHYVTGAFSRAVANFNHVVRARDQKVPEAMYFMAQSYEALSDYSNTIRLYEQLVREHPTHPLSRAAQDHLKIIREGF